MSRFDWYESGVRFECTQCGGCCTGGPGAVWISGAEVERIAQFLKISVDDFSKLYTRLLSGKRALKELPNDYDCIFLKDKKICTVYSARPLQCQTFPFWPGIMESQESWQAASLHCEGINDEAKLVQLSHIKEQLDRHQLNS